MTIHILNAILKHAIMELNKNYVCDPWSHKMQPRSCVMSCITNRGFEHYINHHLGLELKLDTNVGICQGQHHCTLPTKVRFQTNEFKRVWPPNECLVVRKNMIFNLLVLKFKVNIVQLVDLSLKDILQRFLLSMHISKLNIDLYSR